MANFAMFLCHIDVPEDRVFALRGQHADAGPTLCSDSCSYRDVLIGSAEESKMGLHVHVHSARSKCSRGDMHRHPG